MRSIPLAIAVAFILLIPSAQADEERVLCVATNPDPQRLPSLSVWQEYAKKQDRFETYIAAEFPNVPGLTCDCWCFESDGIHFMSARELPGGRIELLHTWDEHDEQIVTTATPREGALDIVATLSGSSQQEGKLPEEYPGLNICWQLRRAKGFSSEKDRYPEFVQRCFIFTDRGRIFLHNTTRRPIPVRSLTDKRNNPPWVQMYASRSAPADLRAAAKGWAAYSPDRYVYPIIGAASRDGKYLTAMATGAERVLSQAWHDCLHNNARWLPGSDGAEKQWRVRIYAMENDPDELVRRFREDFPHVSPWE